MNTDTHDTDVELQEWLAAQEDGPGLAAAASRISRFASDKIPSTAFKRQLQSRAFPVPRSLLRRKLLPMAAAASLLLGGVGIGSYLSQPSAPSELAWGDVVSAMQPVDSFHVTVFNGNPDASQNMQHYDVYYRRPNLWRAQGMNRIQLGIGAQARLYDVTQGKFALPSREFPGFIPVDFADALERQSLLDAMVKTMFDPNRPPTANVVNDPALREAGIQVFDYGDKASDITARIWVLERSRLPIRLEVNDPRLGPVTWAVVDYSDPRPADFFDADSFEKNVQTGGPPTTREAFQNHFVVDDVAAWYKLACTWRQPSTALKYSENPADAPTTGFTGAYTSQNTKIRCGYFNVGPVDKLPYYHANGAKMLTDSPLIFVHERASKTLGLKRLIAVNGPTFEGRYLVLNAVQAGPRGGTYSVLESATARVDMAGICGPGEIRLYAGQPDKANDSRFSIPFEANGKKGWIDGVFVGKAHVPSRPGDVLNEDVRFSVRVAAK